MKRGIATKTLSLLLAAGLVVTAAPASVSDAKAKKPKLAKKKITVTVKKSKKVKIKNTKKIKKVTWSVNKKGKKIVKLTKKKKTYVTVKGVKKGKATVTAKVKIKGKKKATKLKLKVTVKKASAKKTTTPAKTAAASSAPKTTNAPVQTNNGGSKTNAPVATTAAPATEAPATEAPATEAPATEAPATDAPATEAPATEAPATDAPATDAPATDAPATEAPATDAPVTEAPATDAPATEAPATDAPATETPAGLVAKATIASGSAAMVVGETRTIKVTATSGGAVVDIVSGAVSVSGAAVTASAVTVTGGAAMVDVTAVATGSATVAVEVATADGEKATAEQEFTVSAEGEVAPTEAPATEAPATEAPGTEAPATEIPPAAATSLIIEGTALPATAKKDTSEDTGMSQWSTLATVTIDKSKLDEEQSKQSIDISLAVLDEEGQEDNNWAYYVDYSCGVKSEYGLKGQSVSLTLTSAQIGTIISSNDDFTITFKNSEAGFKGSFEIKSVKVNNEDALSGSLPDKYTYEPNTTITGKYKALSDVPLTDLLGSASLSDFEQVVVTYSYTNNTTGTKCVPRLLVGGITYNVDQDSVTLSEGNVTAKEVTVNISYASSAASPKITIDTGASEEGEFDGVCEITKIEFVPKTTEKTE